MKKNLTIILLLIAATFVSCGDDQVTDYYTLEMRQEHDYFSGGMEKKVDLKYWTSSNKYPMTEEEAVAILEQEFTEEMTALTSTVNDTSTLEHATKEESALVKETIKEEIPFWKRWLICISHPSKYDSKEVEGKIKELYKDIVQKGEYEDGPFKVKVIPIKGSYSSCFQGLDGK